MCLVAFCFRLCFVLVRQFEFLTWKWYCIGIADIVFCVWLLLFQSCCTGFSGSFFFPFYAYFFPYVLFMFDCWQVEVLVGLVEASISQSPMTLVQDLSASHSYFCVLFLLSIIVSFPILCYRDPCFDS